MGIEERDAREASIPPPYAYEPAEVFGSPDEPRFAVLRVTPSRITLVDLPAPPGKAIVWRASADPAAPRDVRPSSSP